MEKHTTILENVLRVWEDSFRVLEKARDISRSVPHALMEEYAQSVLGEVSFATGSQGELVASDDTLWAYGIRTLEKVGSLKNWRDFRKHVLESDFYSSELFGFQYGENTKSALVDIIPKFLHGWARHSRKVIRVGVDEVISWWATELKKHSARVVSGAVLTNEDVRLPMGVLSRYPAILIEYDKEHGSRQGFLYIGYPDTEMNILMIPHSIRQYTRINPCDISPPLSSKRRLAYLRTHVRTIAKRSESFLGDITLVQSAAADIPNIFECSKKELFPFLVLAYISAAYDVVSSPTSLEPHQRSSNSGRSGFITPVIDERSVVMDPDDICCVANNHVIHVNYSRKRGTFKKTGGYEVDPHERGAHRRRPPGKGNDPFAEKTVLVRKTTVRRDRIPAGAITKGSLVEIKR